MSVLICGSLAFDTITTFAGHFAQQILPDQLHILNVSFLVPTLKREFGGCAGNVAYTLKKLGGEPLVVASLGADGGAYLTRLQEWGLDTRYVQCQADSYTAQAIIITDQDNNQITAFHPGAMQQAHLTPIPSEAHIQLALIAPDGREAMLEHAEQLAAAKIPFIFDPGQGLPMFNGAELQHFVDQATWVTVNDYEAKMLSERLGTDLAALSSLPHLQAVIVTLGGNGCELWRQGQRTHITGVAATQIVDPTGCGDAFRGALLYGLAQDWPLERCLHLANHAGAIKIACAGPQNHDLSSLLGLLA